MSNLHHNKDLETKDEKSTPRRPNINATKEKIKGAFLAVAIFYVILTTYFSYLHLRSKNHSLRNVITAEAESVTKTNIVVDLGLSPTPTDK